MNVADSQRVYSALEQLGYDPIPQPEQADIIILNTCVVRQSAEDKAYGRLTSLRPIKEKNPGVIINLMGCLVGVKDNPGLKKRFPYVDVLSPPSDPRPLLNYLAQREGRQIEVTETMERFALMDGELILPCNGKGKPVCGFIPAVYGCSYACTYCIIPHRRGAEQSRPPEEILREAHSMVNQGVKEITLLGQIIDRYGKDRPGYPDLSGLLRQLHEIDGLERIRFLTSHPNYINDALLDCVAELPKVMPHIEVPIQSGDDQVLANMKRGYNVEQYRRLIKRIRERIPNVYIANDIIVGFPGETEDQFQNTVALVNELRLDVAHLARYSPRTGTVSERRMADDVPAEEKKRRFRVLEELQTRISAEINAQYMNQNVEVLFEERSRQRWKGRTPQNKLVFVETENELGGKILPVRVTWTGPWTMIGELA